jgi:hypothetical protein
MYCPNCGTNQPDDKKFCSACGTNLGVVSAALSGQPPAPLTSAAAELAAAEARYKRLTAAAAQGGMPGLGLLAAALLVFLVRPIPGAWFWICFGLTIGGISALGRGVAAYLVARSEWQAALARLSHPPAPAPASTPAPLNSAAPTNRNLTPPPSVTEHTTRHLG